MVLYVHERDLVLTQHIAARLHHFQLDQLSYNYIWIIPFQEQVGVVYSISGVQPVGHTLVNISHSVLPGHLCKQQ